MPLTLDGAGIALRLLVAAPASAAIGINCGEANRPVRAAHDDAGDACRGDLDDPGQSAIADDGKGNDFFVVMDLVRLLLDIE
jgi:hypothetical protein